jgi:hypothetical protein
MSGLKWFVEHPYVGFLLAIAGLMIGALSLVEPRYEDATDGDKCGFTSNVVQHRDHEFQLCAHPSHELTGYQFTETVSGSSGWRGGGYNPTAWCNDVKRAKENSVGQSIVWSNQRPREESKKDLLGKVEYNYHCTITAQWGPIYATVRSPACGPEPFVDRVAQEPNTCPDTTNRVGWKWTWM